MTSKETLNHSRAALKAAKAGPAKEKVATVLESGALGVAKDARQQLKLEKAQRAQDKKDKEALEEAKAARKAKKEAKKGGGDLDPLAAAMAKMEMDKAKKAAKKKK